MGFATYLSVMVTLPCNSHGVDLAGVVFELDAATVVEVNGRAAVAHCGRLTIRLPRPTPVEIDTSSQTAGRKDVSMRRSFPDLSSFSASTESDVTVSLCHRRPPPLRHRDAPRVGAPRRRSIAEAASAALGSARNSRGRSSRSDGTLANFAPVSSSAYSAVAVSGERVCIELLRPRDRSQT